MELLKCLFFVATLSLLSNCDGNNFVPGPIGEMKLNEGTPIVYSIHGDRRIIKQTGGVATLVQSRDANYYFQHDDSSSKQFVLSCSHFDWAERLDTMLWSNDGNAFSFFVKCPRLYYSGARLVLYRVVDERVSLLIDIRDREIDKHFFINDYFRIIFSDYGKDSISIKL